MRRSVASFVAGALFAIGLALAGMTQPAKVVGFLDFFGDWDPSLACVMGGAIGVHFVLFRWVMRRRSPLLEETFQIPARRDLTPRLLLGASLFGVGWGLGGYCPGPGIASLLSFAPEAAVFVLAMALGMAAYARVERTGRNTSRGRFAR